MRWFLFVLLGALACQSDPEAEPSRDAAKADGALDAARVAADATPDAAPAGDSAANDMRPGDAAVDPADAAAVLADAAPLDAAVVPDAAAGLACQAPFGINIGDVMAPLALPDCDGTMHNLHDLCGEVGFFFEFAAWCPPCRRFAHEFPEFWAQFEGVRGFLILSADENFMLPNAEDCRRIRDQYDLPVPVLYDPDGALGALFRMPANDMAFVTRADGTLVFKEHYSSRAEKEAALREALAAP